VSQLTWQAVINKAKREAEFRIGNRKETGLAAVSINVIIKGDLEPLVYSVESRQVNPMETSNEIISALCQSVDRSHKV
jgi:hypothetical protein